MKMKEGIAWQADKLRGIRVMLAEIEKGVAKLEKENVHGYVRDSLTGSLYDRLRNVETLVGMIKPPDPHTIAPENRGLFAKIFGA